MVDSDDFARDLIALVPPMRAFARMLCNGNAAAADDLAQEAWTKAWSARGSFAIGTMKSRVSRARDAIALIYADGDITTDGELPAFAMASIFQQVATLTARAPL
jgi:hypothetical protein